jgi:hypothetical protein
MQFVPNDPADKAEDVSSERRDNNERKRCQRIERLDDINRLDHVRPENEINQRLRPVKQNQEHPEQMPSADQRANYEAYFIWVGHKNKLARVSAVHVLAKFAR